MHRHPSNLHRAAGVSVCLGLLVFAACSSDGTSSSPAPDASTSDSATPVDANVSDTSPTDSGADTTMDAPTDSPPTVCMMGADAGAACNTLVQIGTDKPVVAAGTAIPTGTGGTIVDGRYVLTDFTSYTGSLLTGITLKQTLEMCAGTAQLIGDEPGKPQYRKSFTYAPNGTAPNVSATTCSTQSPNANLAYSSYTATPTTFTLYSTDYLFSVTFTKQ